ncbi:hypothetical protein [Streptosporangium subroseum]|uniref:hypothetical protein n=1 Tax=Streptosporangium subroseum TaxID=106412 RepID=UPI00308E8E27|nr:hypothetical protein OHB15_47350 [Streptosporangium subroseum]
MLLLQLGTAIGHPMRGRHRITRRAEGIPPPPSTSGLLARPRGESTWGIQHLATVEKALAPHTDHTVRELLGDIAATRRNEGSSPA